MQAGIFERAQSWRRVFAWPVKAPTPAQRLDLELGQSHTSRPILDARRGVDPMLVAAADSQPVRAPTTTRWEAPAWTVVPP
jgi:hypothetical protein